MKINFNVDLVDLEGNKVQATDERGTALPHNENLGKLLGQVLATETQGDPIKYFEWAQKMHNGKEIDLDTSDQKTLQDFIKTTPKLTAIVKAQLLALFDKK